MIRTKVGTGDTVDVATMTNMPAVLPTLSEYLTDIAPAGYRQELWCWAASVVVPERRGSRVVDLTFPPGPRGFVGEEWVPIAAHPRWSIWIVRRRQGQ